MDATSAENLLIKTAKDGCFLIRISGTRLYYVLTLFYRNEVYHWNIIQTRDGKVHFDEDSLDFNTLEDLVVLHAKTKRHLPCLLRCAPNARPIVQTSLAVGSRQPCVPMKLNPPPKSNPQRVNVERKPKPKCKCMWEIDIDELEMIGKIGNGSFGVVHQAKLRGTATVAVKMMIKGSMTEDEFIKEADHMT